MAQVAAVPAAGAPSDRYEAESATSDAELLPQLSRKTHIGGFRRKPLAAAAAVAAGAAASLVGAGALAGLLASAVSEHPKASATGHTSRDGDRPATIRSLLEGEELADVAADNALALGGPEAKQMGWPVIRSRVAIGFKDISKRIQEELPQAHKQMETVELTTKQKDSALHALRSFRDPRMMDVARAAMDSLAKSRLDGDGPEEKQRKLAERLAPSLSGLRQLSEEVLAGHQSLSIGVDGALPGWRGRLEVDPDRRLAEAEDPDRALGVHAQARTLFNSLEGQLGDAMPKAPSRMLFSISSDGFSSSPSNAPPTSSGQSGDNGQSFMSCLEKAVPNPMECMSCASSHMPDVLSMLESVMKMKMR